MASVYQKVLIRVFGSVKYKYSTYRLDNRDSAHSSTIFKLNVGPHQRVTFIPTVSNILNKLVVMGLYLSKKIFRRADEFSGFLNVIINGRILFSK